MSSIPREPPKMDGMEPVKHAWNMADREPSKMIAGEPRKNCVNPGSKEPPKRPVVQR